MSLFCFIIYSFYLSINRDQPNKLKPFSLIPSQKTLSIQLIMSDKCGNCDCADTSKCVKKGNSYGIDLIETEKSYFVMDAPASENDGKCKCGSSCSCANCTCGGH